MKLKQILGICLLCMSFSLVGCTEQNTSTNTGNAPAPVQQPVVENFHKTIDVKILDIQHAYYKPTHVFTIKVKNDEYNVEKTYQLNAGMMSGDKYTYELGNGQLKVGDTIKAELGSRVVNGQVESRWLNGLQ